MVLGHLSAAGGIIMNTTNDNRWRSLHAGAQKQASTSVLKQKKKDKVDQGTTEKIGRQIQKLVAHKKYEKKCKRSMMVRNLTIIDFGLHDVIFPPGWPCFNAGSTPSDDWGFSKEET